MSGDVRDRGRSIRSATEEDFARIMEIDRHSFSAPWIYNFFKSALNNIFLVLEKEREIAGYLIACVCHDLEKAVILRIALVENEQLRCAPAHHHGQLLLKLLSADQIFVLFRHLHGVAQRPLGRRDDADFVYRVSVRQHLGHQCVAAFVIGDAALDFLFER